MAIGFVWMAGGIVLGPFAPATLAAGVVAILVGFWIYPNRRRLFLALIGLALGSWWIVAFAVFGQEWFTRQFTS